jgi:hypothetical protein
MANPSPAITQNVAKRLLKAVLQAGFGSAKITLYPDVRIEAYGSLEETAVNPNSENTWDKILK